MTRFAIVNTDNFGGDYPDEKFVENLPSLNKREDAERIANAINSIGGPNSYRYFKVVELPYDLASGFEP